MATVGGLVLTDSSKIAILLGGPRPRLAPMKVRHCLFPLSLEFLLFMKICTVKISALFEYVNVSESKK
jgi:hypothetical protein